jgi:hypothetical protein
VDTAGLDHLPHAAAGNALERVAVDDRRVGKLEDGP